MWEHKSRSQFSEFQSCFRMASYKTKGKLLAKDILKRKKKKKKGWWVLLLVFAENLRSSEIHWALLCAPAHLISRNYFEWCFDLEQHLSLIGSKNSNPYLADNFRHVNCVRNLGIQMLTLKRYPAKGTF